MTARTRLGRVARLLSGAAVLALTGAVVLAADRLPEPALAEGRPDAVDVAAPRSTLVCPGPLILPDDTGAGDSEFDPTPVEPVTQVDALTVAGEARSAADGTLSALGTDEPVAEVEVGGEGGTAHVAEPDGPLVVRAEPVDGAPARVAASMSSLVTAGDLRGLSAASCQRPGVDLWLVGGSTALESSASLVLTNPGTTPSDVQVEIWGPSGPVELAGSGRELVAPGGERVLSLPAIAAEQRRVAVHVVASGGAVTAHLQDSRLSGFTPAGTDLVVPGAPPANRQVVAGVSVPESAVGDPAQGVLRVLAPGERGATVRLTLVGTEGVTPLPGTDALEVAAGEVTDVPLGGLPAGSYTAVVDADQPVVAAAMTARVGRPGELDDTPTLERAWSASGLPGRGGILAIPARTAPTVVVTGVPDDEDLTAGASVPAVLRAIGTDGDVVGEQPLDIEPGVTLALPAVARPADGSAPPTVAGVELIVEPEDSPGDEPLPVAWGVILGVSAADGPLFSVLLPAADAPTGTQVPVRAGTRLGLD